MAQQPLTEADEHTTPITLPENGDLRNVASLTPAVQGLANRTSYANSRIEARRAMIFTTVGESDPFEPPEHADYCVGTFVGGGGPGGASGRSGAGGGNSGQLIQDLWISVTEMRALSLVWRAKVGGPDEHTRLEYFVDPSWNNYSASQATAGDPGGAGATGTGDGGGGGRGSTLATTPSSGHDGASFVPNSLDGPGAPSGGNGEDATGVGPGIGGLGETINSLRAGGGGGGGGGTSYPAANGGKGGQGGAGATRNGGGGGGGSSTNASPGNGGNGGRGGNGGGLGGFGSVGAGVGGAGSKGPGWGGGGGGNGGTAGAGGGGGGGAGGWFVFPGAPEGAAATTTGQQGIVILKWI